MGYDNPRHAAEAMEKQIAAFCVILLGLGTTASAMTVDTLQTVTFSYDGAGRLTEARFDASSRITFAYDRSGNLTSRVVEATSVLAQIVVEPAQVELAPGSTQQFTAAGFDGDGEAAAFAPAWSATGGSIDENGLFVAGNTAGDYVVTARDSVTGVEGTAAVSIVSGVSSETEQLPDAFALHPNYPNPFNPVTRIGFDVKETSIVTLRIYDTLGREVELLVNGVRPPGRYHALFAATALPSGVYVYSIRMGDFRASRTMLLIK